jgi:hypothetical protein
MMKVEPKNDSLSTGMIKIFTTTAETPTKLKILARLASYSYHSPLLLLPLIVFSCSFECPEIAGG